MRALSTRLGNALILCGATTFASGCYTYVPATFSTVPTGESVRVYLTQSGVDRLRQMGGEAMPELGSRPVLTGKLVRRDATDFSLQIPVGSRQSGFMRSELGQQITLPVSDLVQVEWRQVSGTRSALATAGVSVVLAAVVVTALKGARAPGGSAGSDPDNLRMPLLSIPPR
ncbi:MAG: hypothetical protein EXR93_12580 [Gemmatimonadetes bacterium]|nr:hypothetical protein [Gemmatimonadota bacterium]